MLSLLAGVLRKLIYFLLGILPESPFANALGTLPASIENGLAWLNTFIPMESIVLLIGLWAVALVNYIAVRLILEFTLNKVTSVFGISVGGSSS